MIHFLSSYTFLRSWFWWFLTSSLVAHRFFILIIPFFYKNVTEFPFLNCVCGLISDFVLIGLWAFIWVIPPNLRLGKKIKFCGRILVRGFVVVFVIALAVHIRYVEHFGSMLKFYHLLAMNSGGDAWKFGPWMVLASWRSVGFLGVTCTLAFLPRLWITKGYLKTFLTLTPGVWIVLVTLLLHATHLQIRNHPKIHKELRYNPVSSLFYSWKEEVANFTFSASRTPDDSELTKIRSLLGQKRFYTSTKYPLWQERVAFAETVPSKFSQEIRNGLRQWLLDEGKKYGPWNVVIVLSESMRAQEIGLLEDENTSKSLTPSLDRLAKEDGVIFSEAYGVGLETHFGQSAVSCSLYTFDRFSIFLGAPMSRATCLSDIFANQNYETFFFYPADNHFDNQSIFYPRHSVKYVIGGEDFPVDSIKGGWGLSDHALFSFALTKFQGVQKPFFAKILTLTNHEPRIIPKDAPSGVISPELPIAGGQMVQYVDWAFGDFYESLKKQNPHTLVIYIADHGAFLGEPYGKNPSFEELRRIARIPFIFFIPNLPDHLKGARIDSVVSSVDVAPTLLGLFGWEETPQQFMGEDAFQRQNKIFLNWQGHVQVVDQGHQITELESHWVEILGYLIRNNRLAPNPLP